MTDTRLRRVIRGLYFAALFLLLVGFWLGDTHVVEQCVSGACQELLVSDRTAGTAMFVAAPILCVAGLALSAWRTLRVKRERAAASRPSVF